MCLPRLALESMGGCTLEQCDNGPGQIVVSVLPRALLIEGAVEKGPTSAVLVGIDRVEVGFARFPVTCEARGEFVRSAG